MKQLLLSATFLLFCSTAWLQVIIDSPEYQQLKTSGQLSGTPLTLLPNPNLVGGTPVVGDPLMIPKANSCDCYIEPDSTYILALAPNDDGSSAVIPIPFDFCMYGQTFDQIYINNNGNVTFTSSMSTFSATAFPSSTNGAIVAPFWGDVDTRPSPGSPGSTGRVVYKITPTAVFVNWEDVGYYSMHGDLRNTFQLIMTDGADPIIEGGNVAFCYQDMQWTTGDASQGSGGFGGIPATAGANKGDGIAYFLIARFDHPGNDFDGALGDPDGISWLDNKSFAFDACNVGNIPPIPDGVSSCDTFKICAEGDTAHISINFLSPETDQTTSITYDNGGLSSLLEIDNIPGNTAQLILRAISTPAEAGFYTITVTATDDAAPIPGVTTLTFVLQLDTTGLANFDPVLSMDEQCDTVLLSVLNGPYDSYLWDNLSHEPEDGVGFSQDYGVTVSLNNCYRRIHEWIDVVEPFDVNLQGPLTYCPPETTVTLTIPNAAYYDTVSWSLQDLAQDTLFTNELGAGTYTIHLEDTFGLCIKDTTFTITTQQELILQPDTAICSNIFLFTGNTGGTNTGTWTALNNPPVPPVFADNTLNTQVTFGAFGTYTLVFTEGNCFDSDTIQIIYSGPPQFNFDADFFVCPGEDEFLFVSDSLNMDEISWGLPDPAEDSLYSANLSPGSYTVELTNIYGCENDTSFTITTQPPVQIDNITQICGDSLEMSDNSGPEHGMWTYYNSAGTVNFRHIDSLNTGLEVSAYGTYNLVFTESVCNDSDTVTIDFIPYPYVHLNDSLELCVGQSVGVFANDIWPNFTDELYWNTGETTTSILVSSAGIYIVTVENHCGSHTDSIVVTAKVCDFELPNVFTPNGMGENNTWKLLTVDDIFKEFRCVIVNRWGNVVYEFDDPQGGWDGKDRNGNDVGEGIYFYTIDFTTIADEELQKQGFIHLIR